MFFVSSITGNCLEKHLFGKHMLVENLYKKPNSRSIKFFVRIHLVEDTVSFIVRDDDIRLLRVFLTYAKNDLYFHY